MQNSRRYAFFPGCVSRGACQELYQSITQVAPKLGLELIELEQAACTGFGVLSERSPKLADVLNARTFAMAEAEGLPLLNICSTCQGVMSKVQYKLRENSELLDEVNELLAEEGLNYSGEMEIKNFLWVLVEDIGLDELKSLVVQPLDTLNVAPFYGCYILRPSWELGLDENPERATYLEQVISVLGGTAVDFAGKDKCCGFPILTMNRTNSLTMAATHLLDAKGEGADCMVTPCPLCHLNLDANQPDAAKVKKEKLDLPVLHLPQLVGLALGIEPSDLGLGKNIVPTKGIVEQVKA